jgi:transposase
VFLRTLEIKRNGRVYRYTQLLESYRRASDGRPAQRIIGKLGELSPDEVANFKLAIKANRDGARVALAAAPASVRATARPKANLRYLDLAVLLELWRQWQLDELLDELMPVTEKAVSSSKVLAALVLQRCVDPGSKLYAERWFPRTSLPELLDLPSGKFNNTRLHRELDKLDRANEDLMAKLSHRVHTAEGQFSCLFLDITDTWFVGHGPELAHRAKTKEGMVRRKVGIALLCNSAGHPLRWQVLHGSQADCSAMEEIVDAVAGLSWVNQVPFVMDRAMGHTAQLHKLVQSGVHFVTALTATEVHSYCELPAGKLEHVTPNGPTDKAAMLTAKKKMKAAGMTEISDSIFVMDLGISDSESLADNNESVPNVDKDPTAHALRLGRMMHDDVTLRRVANLAAAARMRGVSYGQARKYHRLAIGLAQDIQLEILHNQVSGISLTSLLKLLGCSNHDEQYSQFKKLAAGKRRQRNISASADPQKAKATELPVVRLVANFNPAMFVEQRYKANAADAHLQQFVAERNARANRHKIHIHVAQELRRLSMTDLYEVCVDTEKRCQLVRDEQLWAKKRQLDGFNVLVVHRDMKQPPEQLVRLYRSKNAVENDFKIIKSLVKIRPVRHRTNAKVRAHVTLCMLALLLQKTLSERLDGLSAERAIEQLSTCCLNHYQQSGTASAYTITQPDDEQLDLLRKLGLTRLVDQSVVADRLTPR